MNFYIQTSKSLNFLNTLIIAIFLSAYYCQVSFQTFIHIFPSNLKKSTKIKLIF